MRNQTNSFISALPLPGCATLGRLYNLSEAEFLLLYNGAVRSRAVRMKGDNDVRCLDQCPAHGEHPQKLTPFLLYHVLAATDLRGGRSEETSPGSRVQLQVCHL